MAIRDCFVCQAHDSRDSAPKAVLTTLQLLGVLFVGTVGGAYGLESCVQAAGPLVTLLGILVLPWVWGLPSALVVAELATSVPSNAGPIMWVNCAMPTWVTMLTVQWTVLLDVVDNSLYPNLFIEYLQRVVRVDPISRVFLQAALIGCCTLLNIQGIEQVGSSGSSMMLLAVMPFALLFLLQTFGTWEGAGLQADHLSDIPSSIDWRAFIPLISWNFSGFENAGHVVEEVAVPGRALINALGALLLLAQLVYALPVIAGVSAMHRDTNPLIVGGEVREATDYSSWAEGYWVPVARAVGGAPLENLMVFGGAVSAFGFTLCALCTTSRALQGISNLGCFGERFNRCFGSLHPVYKTPAKAIMLNAAVTFVLTVTLSFEVLVTIEQVLYALRLIAVFASAVILRHEHPTLHRPFAIPGGVEGVCVTVAPAVLWALLVIGSSLSGDTEQVLHVAGILALTTAVSIHHSRVSGFKLDGKIAPRAVECRRRNNSLASCGASYV